MQEIQETDPPVYTEESEDEVVDILTPPAIIDNLKKMRMERLKREPKDLEIPGYEGLLWVRYKYVEYEENEELTRRVMNQADKLKSTTISAAADFLANACVEILTPSGEAGAKLRPIDPRQETPTRFDQHMAGLFDIPVPEGSEGLSAREVVRGVFANDYALVEQYIDLSRWLSGVSRGVDTLLLGE